MNNKAVTKVETTDVNKASGNQHTESMDFPHVVEFKIPEFLKEYVRPRA